MPQNLDAVINDLAGKVTRKWGDAGVATRFLSRVQNGVPGIAIITALIQDILANGGYAEVQGGKVVRNMLEQLEQQQRLRLVAQHIGHFAFEPQAERLAHRGQRSGSTIFPI